MTQSWLVPVGLLALLFAAAFIADRRVRDRKRSKVHPFKMGHRPVPEDLQLVFGAYVGGHDIHSLIVKNDGIHVTYVDGSAYLFLAVPDGCGVVVNKDGNMEVRDDA